MSFGKKETSLEMSWRCSRIRCTIRVMMKVSKIPPMLSLSRSMTSCSRNAMSRKRRIAPCSLRLLSWEIGWQSLIEWIQRVIRKINWLNLVKKVCHLIWMSSKSPMGRISEASWARAQVEDPKSLRVLTSRERKRAPMRNLTIKMSVT